MVSYKALNTVEESIFAYIGNIVWYLNVCQAAASAEGIFADRCNSWRYSNVL